MKTTLITLLIALVIGSIFYYHHHKNQPFRCETLLVSHIEQNEIKIDINLNAYIILSLNGEGIVLFNGTVTQDSHNYRVSRKIFFTTTPSELEGFNKTKVTREQVSEVDEVPAELWNQQVFPGSELYTQMTAVNKNGFVFSGLSYPYFVCVRTDN